MKVLLRSDVNSLGRKGDIKEVKDGYARNYLIPRGLALKATKGVEQQAASMRRAREQREAQQREEATALATKLEQTPVTVTARVGAEGKLFGSITPADIINAIDKQLSLAVDRHALRIDAPIKALGEHTVSVQLHDDVSATIRLDVVAAS